MVILCKAGKNIFNEPVIYTSEGVKYTLTKNLAGNKIIRTSDGYIYRYEKDEFGDAVIVGYGGEKFKTVNEMITYDSELDLEEDEEVYMSASPLGHGKIDATFPLLFVNETESVIVGAQKRKINFLRNAGVSRMRQGYISSYFCISWAFFIANIFFVFYPFVRNGIFEFKEGDIAKIGSAANCFISVLCSALMCYGGQAQSRTGKSASAFASLLFTSFIFIAHLAGKSIQHQKTSLFGDLFISIISLFLILVVSIAGYANGKIHDAAFVPRKHASERLDSRLLGVILFPSLICQMLLSNPQIIENAIRRNNLIAVPILVIPIILCTLYLQGEFQKMRLKYFFMFSMSVFLAGLLHIYRIKGGMLGRFLVFPILGLISAVMALIYLYRDRADKETVFLFIIFCCTFAFNCAYSCFVPYMSNHSLSGTVIGIIIKLLLAAPPLIAFACTTNISVKTWLNKIT